jgi:hypothetical protein
MPSTCKPLNLPVKATHSQPVSLFKSMDLPSNQITLYSSSFLVLGNSPHITCQPNLWFQFHVNKLIKRISYTTSKLKKQQKIDENNDKNWQTLANIGIFYIPLQISITQNV